MRLDGGCSYAGTVLLVNRGDAPAAFAVAGASGSRALPGWLDASPASGVVAAGSSRELCLRGAPVSPQWGVLVPQSEVLLVAAAPAGGAAAAAWPAGDLAVQGGAAALQVLLS